MREYDIRSGRRPERPTDSPLLREGQLLDLLLGDGNENRPERARPGDVLIVAQRRPVNESELRQPVINYCREMLRGAGPAVDGVRPGRPSDERDRLIRQIAGILDGCTDQADRERVARQLCTYLNGANLRGYHFNLSVVDGSNNPSRPATIEGTFRQTVGGRTETVRILPIPIDNRFWSEEAVTNLNGLIREYFQAGENAGQAAAIRARFRAVWRTVPAGQRENVRTALNTRLQTHVPPLYVVHPPRNAARPQDGLNLELIDVRQGVLPNPNAQQANAGDQPVGNRPMPVGQVNERQQQQIDARRLVDRRREEETGWNFLEWFEGLPLSIQLGALAGTGAATYGALRYGGPATLRGGWWLTRQLGRGTRYTAGAGWNALFGRRSGQPTDSAANVPHDTTTGEPLRQTSEEARDVSARQPRTIEGANAQARAQNVETALQQARAQNPGNPFFHNDTITDYRARCLEFINTLSNQTGTADRAQQLTEFIRRTGSEMFPEHAEVFNRIRVVESTTAHEGTVVAEHTFVHGSDGRLAEIRVALPTNRLRGNVSEANLHETLGSLYDQLYRVHRQSTLTAAANNDAAQTTTRRSGNALADFVQFSVNQDNAVRVDQHANEARVALHGERAVGGARLGYMEIHADGRMVVANEQGREVSEPQARERALADQVATEIERMRARRQQLLDTAATLDGEARANLERQAEALHTQVEAAQARHATLTSTTESPARATARRTLSESFRRAYERGRARFGGRVVPLAMFAEEAVRWWLTH
ncbi:MAG: hypothetical protein C5B53_06540 [Candidatus Melainabacteria bacterium]|nr:MAG: hypothetical protein C5B53_06540 [Candidatus Melainabacteria bacterium]